MTVRERQRRTYRRHDRSPYAARTGPVADGARASRHPGRVSQALYEITVNALLDRDRPLTAAEWDAAAARVGGNRVPLLLAELDDAGLLDDELLPAAVRQAWAGADDAVDRLGPARWAELFAAAGVPVPPGAAVTDEAARITDGRASP